MPAVQRQPLPFPLRGVMEMQNPSQTPPEFAYRALNVVGFDPIANRLRGGKRPGTGRVITDALTAGSPVQRLGQITLTADQFLTGSFFTDGDADANGQGGWGFPDFEWTPPANNDPIDSEAQDILIGPIEAVIGTTTVTLVWTVS